VRFIEGAQRSVRDPQKCPKYGVLPPILLPIIPVCTTK
jgi:hypothetical protein